MPRLVAVALAVLPGLVLVSGPAAAESPTLARVVKSGTLRVGMSGGQPPMNFVSASGEHIGLEVDIARALAALMKVELEIVRMPFAELLGSLEKGKVDLVMSGMTITPERNMKVAFIGPYFLSGKSILTKSATLAAADETEDLDQADLSFAALAGSTSQEFVEQVLPRAKLVTTPGYEEAVKLLLDDEVHAVVADFEACALHAFLNPAAGLETLAPPLTVEPYGIAVPPGDGLLMNFLENTLGALQASGLLEALAVRWLEEGDWVSELPKPGEAALPGGAPLARAR